MSSICAVDERPSACRASALRTPQKSSSQAASGWWRRRRRPTSLADGASAQVVTRRHLTSFTCPTYLPDGVSVTPTRTRRRQR